MARKLCLQLLSHFLQSSLYFFLPRSSRKNAHSSLRYFGIRGIGATSFVLPNCRFAPETQKRPNPDPAVWFRGDFGVFLRYERLFFSGGILTVRHSKAVVCHFRVTKKRRICFLLIRMNYKKQKQSGGKDEQFRLFVFFVLRKAL